MRSRSPRDAAAVAGRRRHPRQNSSHSPSAESDHSSGASPPGRSAPVPEKRGRRSPQGAVRKQRRSVSVERPSEKRNRSTRQQPQHAVSSVSPRRRRREYSGTNEGRQAGDGYNISRGGDASRKHSRSPVRNKLRPSPSRGRKEGRTSSPRQFVSSGRKQQGVASGDEDQDMNSRHGKKIATNKPDRHGGAGDFSVPAGSARKNVERHGSGVLLDKKIGKQTRPGRSSSTDEERSVPGLPQISHVVKRQGDGAAAVSGFTSYPIAPRRHDQTCRSLNSRFTGPTDPTSFVPAESITIEIDRTVHGNEPFVIPEYSADAVVVLRRPGEGSRPFDNREEFKRIQEEEEVESSEEERRVVKVIGTYKYAGDVRMENFSVRRGVTVTDVGSAGARRRDVVSSGDKLKHQDSRRHRSGRDGDSDNDARPGKEQKRSRHKGDVAADKDRKHREKGQQGSEDLRANIERRRHERDPDKFDARQKLTAQRGEVTNRKRGNDVDLKTIDEPPKLPAFSKRPDKYSYEPWQDRPEMIPRGGRYYEHDNRDEDDFNYEIGGRGRFRGRGGFMGRGFGDRGFGVRGFGVRGFGGRGYGRDDSFAPRRPWRPDDKPADFRNDRRPVVADQWKHDKFEEMLSAEDKQPSSTTEK